MEDPISISSLSTKKSFFFFYHKYNWIRIRFFANLLQVKSSKMVSSFPVWFRNPSERAVDDECLFCKKGKNQFQTVHWSLFVLRRTYFISSHLHNSTTRNTIKMEPNNKISVGHTVDNWSTISSNSTRFITNINVWNIKLKQKKNNWIDFKVEESEGEFNSHYVAHSQPRTIRKWIFLPNRIVAMNEAHWNDNWNRADGYF